MKYVEFRDAIRGALVKTPAGLTWTELRDHLGLPYERPCPEWVARLEREAGLSRAKGAGRAHVWRVGATRKRRR